MTATRFPGLRHHAMLVLLCGLLGIIGVTRAVAARSIVSPADCAPVLGAFDHRVAEADVGWSQATRMSGFAHLRVDRFLASFRNQPLDAGARRAWLELIGGGYRCAHAPCI